MSERRRRSVFTHGRTKVKLPDPTSFKARTWTARGRLAAACGVTPAVAGCEFIGNVFEAGVWSGVIIVVVLIALVIWGISKLFGR